MTNQIIQPATLPPWATVGPRPKDLQHVYVDAEAAYPAILQELGIGEDDEPTAFFVEIARNFIFWDVLIGMRSGRLEIHIKDKSRRWALKNFTSAPVECPACHGSNPACRRCGGTGRMSAVAAGSYAARDMYRRLRGVYPG